MEIDAERFAKQVSLAYGFMEVLHDQAIALLKDIEMQLAQAPEALAVLRPGGYRFATNELSLSLERPEPALARFYGVCFRQFDGRTKSTPLNDNFPPICFVKVVLREQDLEQPEVRFGVFTKVTRPVDRKHKWPSKFEHVINQVMRHALGGPPWRNGESVQNAYQDSFIDLLINGRRVKLADLSDSKAIAERIIEPILTLHKNASH